MYCPMCGRKVADDDLFCRRCGIDLTEKVEDDSTSDMELVEKESEIKEEVSEKEVALEIIEETEGKMDSEVAEKVAEEVAEESAGDVAEKVVEKIVEEEREKKPRQNPSKIASVCAIFAPVSVLIVAVLNGIFNLVPQILMKIIPAYYDGWYMNMACNICDFIVVVLSIGIYFLIYILFTRKYRAKFPAFLWLIVPGIAMLTNISAGVRGLLYWFLPTMVASIFEIIIIIFVCIVEMVVSYFITRAIFIKCLKKQDERTFVETKTPSKAASIIAIYAPITVCIVSFVTVMAGLLSQNFGGLIAQISSILAALFSVAVYFGTYLLFSMKHRAKLSVFLCLMTPGTMIFFKPLYSVYWSIFYGSVYVRSFLAKGISIGSIYISGHNIGWVILTIFISVLQVIIAYFIARAVFIKILQKEE